MKGNYETVERNGKLYKRHQLDFAETDLIPIEEFKNKGREKWEKTDLGRALKDHERKEMQKLHEDEEKEMKRMDRQDQKKELDDPNSGIYHKTFSEGY